MINPKIFELPEVLAALGKAFLRAEGMVDIIPSTPDPNHLIAIGDVVARLIINQEPFVCKEISDKFIEEYVIKRSPLTEEQKEILRHLPTVLDAVNSQQVRGLNEAAKVSTQSSPTDARINNAIKGITNTPEKTALSKLGNVFDEKVVQQQILEIRKCFYNYLNNDDIFNGLHAMQICAFVCREMRIGSSNFDEQFNTLFEKARECSNNQSQYLISLQELLLYGDTIIETFNQYIDSILLAIRLPNLPVTIGTQFEEKGRNNNQLIPVLSHSTQFRPQPSSKGAPKQTLPLSREELNGHQVEAKENFSRYRYLRMCSSGQALN